MYDLKVIPDCDGLKPTDVVFRDTGMSMIIPFPASHTTQLREVDPDNATGFLGTACSNMGCASIVELGKQGGLRKLDQIIAEETQRTAQFFTSKIKPGNISTLFNGARRGVSNFQEHDGTAFTIKTHASDYFTCRVMQGVYKQLVDDGQLDTDRVKECIKGEVNPLAFLFGSFGANISLVSTKPDGTQEYLLGSRPNGTRHVSANEGMDTHETDGKSLHDLCARGLHEELGITPKKFRETTTYALMRELFFVPSAGQFGAHVLYHTTMSSEEIRQSQLSAKDAWENPSFDAIPYTNAALTKHTTEDAKTVPYTKDLLARLACSL